MFVYVLQMLCPKLHMCKKAILTLEIVLVVLNVKQISDKIEQRLGRM